MSNPVVALTRCDDYNPSRIADALKRQFELLGGLERFVRQGDSVLLKPNFIAPKSRRYATQTDPVFIVEMARFLKDFGAKPFVGDSSAWSSAYNCAKALKLDEPLKKLDVPIKDLNRPKWKRIGERKTRVGISSVASDADVIINIPKFKSHQQLAATFAIKNMFGCVPGKEKAIWHFVKGKHTDDFCQLLIDIYKHLNPALTIIDAVTAMDGHGPINGRARPLGWLIGGAEPIACETVCASLIGVDTENFPILRTAKQIGFGCSNLAQIEIVGDNSSKPLCMDFELPNLVPIRFSLLHVCKSIGKQIILLLKATIRKKD